MKQTNLVILILISAALFIGLIMPFQGIAGKSVTVKMATLAPNGSPWHEILKEMAIEWSQLSNGSVTLRIYPGGVAGDEGDMVRKMRIGQLHAAALTTSGLAKITPDVNALAIPLAIDSWETLNRVRDSLAPRLEQTLEEQGFVVLNWGDAGWVRFFVPESSPDVKTVRKAKLFTWAGDDKSIELWKKAGFNVVPLAATDILPGLQSGMINAYNSSTMLALASQWFPFTPYMIDLPWAPLVGATIINKSTWDKIPDDLKLQLKESAVSTSNRLQGEIRKLEEQALQEMVKRGLIVITPDDEQLEEWKKIIYETYPKIRGDYIPADLFDEALRVANSGDVADEQP
jgi:TRAP-type C4-dicarboxylate transport system substrate-binding protein